MILPIDKGENFGDGGVEFGRNERADIEFGERFDEIGIVADGDVLFFRDVEDFLRNVARAFGEDARRSFVIFVVAKSDGELTL